ncbi:MAG: DUF1508 domain-containing protein [Micrococcales bacterium]|nr:DUF1508 domain-containing protein [Micrococcales bacterium]
MFRLEFYEDTRGEYRWRLVSEANGRVVADSAEGYKNKKDCKKIAEEFFFSTYMVEVAELW